jgi:uncharacterized protein (TIGR02118 family)
MVKLLFLCRRRPGLTHEEYVRRVLDGHVPLALRHHPTMRGYVVNAVEHGQDGLPAIDTVAELWFDDLADYRERLYDSAAGRTAIERDVAAFMGGADALLTTEHVQKRIGGRVPLGRRSPGVKLVCPVRRRPGLGHEAFVEHWLERHVPLALRHHPGLSGYVTNVVEGRPDGSAAEWDGVAELHFPSEEALRTGLFDSPAGEAAIRADIDRFIGFTAAYRVAEYVQRRPGGAP